MEHRLIKIFPTEVEAFYSANFIPFLNSNPHVQISLYFTFLRKIRRTFNYKNENRLKLDYQPVDLYPYRVRFSRTDDCFSLDV